MATRGNVKDRYEIQSEVKLLRDKGVRIAVLDVGYKSPRIDYLNSMRDITSGARDLYPLDFKKISAISQSLLEVQCRVVEKTG